MTKPTVFNYQDYVALEAQIADLREENDRLKEKVGNLEIRCRIAEEALTESQNNLLRFAMDRTWIPVRYHEITDAKREENGYPKDWDYLLDFERLPSDEQGILVQTKNGEISYDECYEEDGIYLDSGLDWVDDVVAWMPLPEPYKGGEDE